MQNRNLIVIGVAIFLGLVAILLANSFFSGVQDRQERIAEQNKLARIVVASRELAFGTPLSSQNVRLANWPASSVPAGAFSSIDQVTKANRVALRPIVVGEPVLASRVSGTDGRAVLSANLPDGALAYAVPINDVLGVGGFIRPGDSVDVLLTRQIPGEGATGSDKMTEVVLEAVPVLGIDQVSDEAKTEPGVPKTATLQVDTFGAQKLALARELGTLSLALRNVASQVTGARQSVTARMLSGSRLYIPAKRQPSMAAPRALAMTNLRPPAAYAALPRAPTISGPAMTVVRGVVSTDYEVRRGY